MRAGSTFPSSLFRFGQLDESREHLSIVRVLRLAESKVNLAVERIQLVVNTLRRRLRLKYFVLRADRVLRLFNRLERSRGKKRKDRRPETDDASRGNEN